MEQCRENGRNVVFPSVVGCLNGAKKLRTPPATAILLSKIVATKPLVKLDRCLTFHSSFDFIDLLLFLTLVPLEPVRVLTAVRDTICYSSLNPPRYILGRKRRSFARRIIKSSFQCAHPPRHMTKRTGDASVIEYLRDKPR